MRIDGKRLAKKNTATVTSQLSTHDYIHTNDIDHDSNVIIQDINPLPLYTQSNTRDIVILPLTEKSFLVKGNLLDHGSKLVELVGKYAPEKEGYIFANFRKQSVEHYINTGEVKPYQYTDEQKRTFSQSIHKSTPSSYTSSTSSTVSKERTWSLFQLKTIFQEIRDAFESDSYYQGDSILDVMTQIEEKYIPKPKTIKAVKQ
jgi:hypothetical protein